MSTFNGGGGALKSTTKPAGLLELAHALNAAERAASTTDAPLNNITIGLDLEVLTAAIACTLPIGAALNTTGNVIITGTNYLGASTFNFGSGGDLRSSHLPAAFLEMAQTVAAAEAALTTSPANNVTISFDLEAGTATIAASLPISSTTDATGKVLITATDYLP